MDVTAPRPHVCLDLERVRVGPQGVENFVWPVARDEILAVRESFLVNFFPFIRSEAKTNRQARVAGLLTHFVNEILAVYRAQAAIRRLKERGAEIDLSPRSRRYTAMAEGRPPEPFFVLGLLQAGVQPAPIWRRLTREFPRSLAPNIAAVPLWHVNVGRDIVTPTVGDMILRHAAAIDEKVHYVRLDEWFTPLRPHERAGYGGEPTDAFLDIVMDMVRKAFAAGNEPLLESNASYLRDRIARVLTLADRYLTRLLSTPRRIPRRLWRGTGGLVWARLLSHAVRELGGHVTGHDHAQGQALFVSYNDTIAEYPDCDRFMVRTALQRDIAFRNMRPDLLISDKPPEIVAVPGGIKAKITSSPAPARTRRPAGKKPTAMYVSTVYDDDFVPLTPINPDIVLVDFEARLIAALKALGYDVVVKPHPETKFPPPRGYCDVLGATVVTDRFEDVYDMADVSVFCHANTSALFSAVGFPQPIVVVDAGLHPWQPEAFELFKKRCGYVATSIDAENRVRFDAQELRAALDKAPSLTDARFKAAFFGA